MPPKRKKSSPSSTSNLFEGITFTIAPLGSLKGKVRQEIVRDRLLENGAIEYDDSTANEPVVIIADLQIDTDVIKRYVGLPLATVVDVRWVTDCLLAKQRLDFQDYLPSWDDVPAVTPKPGQDTNSGHNENGGLNEGIASMFDELESIVSASPDKRDRFRGMAYRRAAAAVRKHHHRIYSVPDAEELRSQIGQRSFDKIVEFIETGSVEKAEFLKSDPHVAARQELMGIWGVGPSKAEDLIASGITSISQLRALSDTELSHTLNHNQRLGLMYYDDLLPKMPRAEVEEIFEIVNGSIYQLYGGSGHDRGLKCIVCGSYRRGAAACSDADLLLYWDDTDEVHETAERTLHALVADLTEKGYMLAHFNNSNSDHQSSIFLGIFRSHPERPARRVDLKVWPKKSLPFALMHFTGNADFNRRIRLYAKRNGFKLTDTYLSKGEQILACETEQDVFQSLGLKYVPPTDRTSSTELVSSSGEIVS